MNDLQENYHQSIGAHDVRGRNELVHELKPADVPIPNWELIMKLFPLRT